MAWDAIDALPQLHNSIYVAVRGIVRRAAGSRIDRSAEHDVDHEMIPPVGPNSAALAGVTGIVPDAPGGVPRHTRVHRIEIELVVVVRGVLIEALQREAHAGEASRMPLGHDVPRRVGAVLRIGADDPRGTPTVILELVILNPRGIGTLIAIVLIGRQIVAVASIGAEVAAPKKHAHREVVIVPEKIYARIA